MSYVSTTRRADILSRVLLAHVPPTREDLAHELYVLTGEHPTPVELAEDLDALVAAGLLYMGGASYLLHGDAMAALVRAIDNAALALVEGR